MGRPGYKIETEQIDKEIIALSGKENPKLLFIPTASSDSKGYIRVVKKYFGKRLGCKVDSLNLIEGVFSCKELENKIFSADIVYVGGGNTYKMLKIWKRNNVDNILKKAWEKGKIISGLSAGAVCWFKYFSSDTRKFTTSKSNYHLMRLKGLDWIGVSYVPHFDTEPRRKTHLKKMMRRTVGVAFAVENCCAVLIKDNQYRIITSKKTANAYKVFWVKGKYYQIKIPALKEFKGISNLLRKNFKT